MDSIADTLDDYATAERAAGRSPNTIRARLCYLRRWAVLHTDRGIAGVGERREHRARAARAASGLCWAYGESNRGSVILMRIKMAAIAAGVMIAAAGCGGSAEKDAALQAAWDSFDTGTQSLFCKAAIQDGENFYGPALSVADRAGNGVTQYHAQQFLLEFCPDAWLIGPDRF